MTTFSLSGSSATITVNPAQPFTLAEVATQQSAVDSSGQRYVYERPLRTRTVNLLFTSVTALELASINQFLSVTVGGSRYGFTWTDQLGADHAVRYVRYTWQRKDGGDYTISLELEETL